MAPVALLQPQGQPRDATTPGREQKRPLRPKSLDLLHGSLAPRAVSQLFIARFGPDFEPPTRMGQLEVCMPLTPHVPDPPSALLRA